MGLYFAKEASKTHSHFMLQKLEFFEEFARETWRNIGDGPPMDCYLAKGKGQFSPPLHALENGIFIVQMDLYAHKVIEPGF